MQRVVIITDADGGKYCAGPFRSESRYLEFLEEVDGLHDFWEVEGLNCQNPKIFSKSKG